MSKCRIAWRPPASVSARDIVASDPSTTIRAQRIWQDVAQFVAPEPESGYRETRRESWRRAWHASRERKPSELRARGART
jgi:hypothetical protein